MAAYSRERRAVLGALLLLAIPWCASCSRSRAAEQSTPEGYETLEIRHEPYSGIVGFPEIAEELGYLAPLKLKFMGNTISGPASIQNVATGNTDYGGAFNGAIVKLLAAKAPIQALVGYYGADAETFNGFYVLADSPIKEARDLIGKKVAVNTLGAHSEFMWRDYLTRGGLTDAEIKQTTLVVVPPSNAEQALRQHQVDAAALSQIFRHKAVERGGIRLLFSDYSVYGEFTAGSLVMHKRFIAENPRTVRKFVQATAKALDWARHAPREQVVALSKKIIARRGTAADVDAQKYWTSSGVTRAGGRLADEDFQIWIDWMIKDGQLKPGQIKARDLYTNEFQ